MKPYIIAILIGIALSIAITVMSGCAMNKSTETYENGVYSLTVEQVLFLYWSSTKQIDIRSPLSSVGVGQIETKPDPNSVKAFTDGVVSGLRGF